MSDPDDKPAIPAVEWRQVLSKPAPTKEDIRALRIKCGLTQLESADICHVTLSGWKGWEMGRRKMPQLAWHWFNLACEDLLAKRAEKRVSQKLPKGNRNGS